MVPYRSVTKVSQSETTLKYFDPLQTDKYHTHTHTPKLATLRMLLKPDKLPSFTTSYRPISLMSSIMKLFERVIEQRLCSYLEDIGFINKYQSGFRQNKSTDDHLFRLSQSVMESFNRGEHVVAAFLDVGKLLIMFDTMDSGQKFLCLISPPK